jgi:hypothetical protein
MRLLACARFFVSHLRLTHESRQTALASEESRGIAEKTTKTVEKSGKSEGCKRDQQQGGAPNAKLLYCTDLRSGAYFQASALTKLQSILAILFNQLLVFCYCVDLTTVRIPTP